MGKRKNFFNSKTSKGKKKKAREKKGEEDGCSVKYRSVGQVGKGEAATHSNLKIHRWRE